MVSIAVAKRATVPYVIEANGTVTPLQTVAVTPQVDGIINSVDFQEGQEVQAGQALFHIDPRPYQNAYDQAVAVYKRDSATWANAKLNADAYQKLMKAKVITPLEGQATITTAATSEATLDADKAAIAQAKFNLDNTIIRAPINGKTGSLLVRRGNLVRSGGAAPLVVINQVRPILVRFAIPSSQLGLVLQYGARGGLPVAAVPGGVAPPSPSIDSLAAAAMNPVSDAQGQDPAGAAGDPPASGSGSGAGFTGGPGNGAGGPHRGGAGRGPSAVPGAAATMASNTAGPAGGNMSPVQQGAPTGDRVMGKLSFIDNAVDTATGTVQLKAQFDNSNGRLWAGQFATTSLHLYDEDSALVIPDRALVTGQSGTYVYIVDQADTARQRAVTVERIAGGLAIISSGVHDGDHVVIDGQSRLTPDAAVRLRGANDSIGGPGANGRRGGRGGKGGGRGRRGGNAGGQDGAASGGAGTANGAASTNRQ